MMSTRDGEGRNRGDGMGWGEVREEKEGSERIEVSRG